MAIVKTSITLQSNDDVDALLGKRGNTLKGKSSDHGYDVDTQNGVIILTSWDTALGPVPTQNEVNAITSGDRAAAVIALKVIGMKKVSVYPDRLADFAMMRIASDRASWDKLDAAGKVAAMVTDADLWVSVRMLIESNPPNVGQ